jgi:hypothetical protein
MILDLFRKEVEFENIQGYDDIKDIVKRALDAEDNYDLLFIGPPASAKTLFLLGILESKKGVYFDGPTHLRSSWYSSDQWPCCRHYCGPRKGLMLSSFIRCACGWMRG